LISIFNPPYSKDPHKAVRRTSAKSLRAALWIPQSHFTAEGIELALQRSDFVYQIQYQTEARKAGSEIAPEAPDCLEATEGVDVE